MGRLSRESRARWLVAVAALGVVSTLAVLPSTVASGADTLVPVAQGEASGVLTGMTPVSSTNPSTALTVSFVLKAQQLSQLESEVASGWQGPFLTVSQFAAAYGQSNAYITALESYLQGFGLTTTALPDNLEIKATGTAAQFNAALSILLQNFTGTEANPSGVGSHSGTFYGSSDNPRLPEWLASGILSILGLTNYTSNVSEAVAANATLGTAVGSSTPATSTSSPIPAGYRLPSDFSSSYDLSPLVQAGFTGTGQTIGIVTLASLDPTVPFKFWSDLGLTVDPNRISLVNVDGGAGPVSVAADSSESSIDVEQAGGVAPGANIIVYQAPNTDQGFVDGFFSAASDDIATTISSSWSESEEVVQARVNSGLTSANFAQSFSEAFLEAAAQGQTSFIASGDGGAYAGATGVAGASSSTQYYDLAVNNPADSPYVTAVGGTTPAGTQTYATVDANGNPGTVSVDIPQGMTWNDEYLWPLYAVAGSPNESTWAQGAFLGSGGGASTFYSEPSYQVSAGIDGSFNAYQFVNPTGLTTQNGQTTATTFTVNDSPTLTSGKLSGRMLPDISAMADPQVGYAAYDPSFGGSGYQQYGGTSFVAPQMAAAAAIIDQYLSQPVGFWNPYIYSFAGMGGESPFAPMTSSTLYDSSYYSATGSDVGLVPSDAHFANGNLLYTGGANPIFTPGSGLGTPSLGGIAWMISMRIQTSSPDVTGTSDGDGDSS